MVFPALGAGGHKFESCYPDNLKIKELHKQSNSFFVCLCLIILR